MNNSRISVGQKVIVTGSLKCWKISNENWDKVLINVRWMNEVINGHEVR